MPPDHPCNHSHFDGARKPLPDPMDGVCAECNPVDNDDEPSGKQKLFKLS